MNVSVVARDLLELFLPRGCVACGSRIPPEDRDGLVCVRCRTLLRPPPFPRCPRCGAPRGTGAPADAPCLECAEWPDFLLSARSAVVLEPPADALVHAIKYRGWRPLGELMGRRMAACWMDTKGEALVVPVATTPKRRRVRGYNQAQVLAEVVAREQGVSWVDALQRPSGGTQVRSGPRQRRRNVQDSFRVAPECRSRIRGREVILVDDVLTTGSTAVSAATALCAAGAGSVRLLTFARALPVGLDSRRATSG